MGVFKKYKTFKCILTILIFFLLMAACSKPPTAAEILGKYTSQLNDSPYGDTIELLENGNYKIKNGLIVEEGNYTQNRFRLEFSNGYIAGINNANEFVFTQTIDYLNPDFYDSNGDGYDDDDSTIQKYLPKDFEYYYRK